MVDRSGSTSVDAYTVYHFELFAAVSRFTQTTLDTSASDSSYRPSDLLAKLTPQLSEFEDTMLVEYGVRPSPITPALMLDYPPCFYGTRCAGMDQLKGFGVGKDVPPGIILRAFMTPQQEDQFVKTGKEPVGWRDRVGAWTDARNPCLLDMRRCIQRMVNKFDCDKTSMPRDQILQSFYNEVNKAGGYAREFVLYPAVAGSYNGLQRPVVGFRSDALVAHKKPDGKWWISQEALKYKPPLTEVVALECPPKPKKSKKPVGAAGAAGGDGLKIHTPTAASSNYAGGSTAAASSVATATVTASTGPSFQ